MTIPSFKKEFKTLGLKMAAILGIIALKKQWLYNVTKSS